MHWLPIIFKTCNETLRISVPTVVENLLGHPLEKSVADQRLKEWATTACDLAQISINVEGNEHLKAVRQGETFVVISNHQSTYDIFVLMRVFPGSLRLVAKRQLFQVPMMGRAMKMSGFVSLDRSNLTRARKALNDAIATLDSGINIWIAPEGTRSSDGRLLPFKKGGFMFALAAKRRILPVTVIDTNTVLPSKSIDVRSGKQVTVRFHAPVDPQEFGVDRRDDLVEHVRNIIISGQPKELQTPA